MLVSSNTHETAGSKHALGTEILAIPRSSTKEFGSVGIFSF